MHSNARLLVYDCSMYEEQINDEVQIKPAYIPL